MPPCCMGPFGRPKLQPGSIDLRRTGPIGATHAMRAKPDRAREAQALLANLSAPTLPCIESSK